MKYDGKQIKRDAKKTLRDNFWAIATIIVINLTTTYAVTYLQELINGKEHVNLMTLLMMLVLTTLVASPITIGMLMAYRRVIYGGEKYRAIEIFDWFGDTQKLWLAVKSNVYYNFKLVMWAMVYFVVPTMLTYTIWGESLMSQDTEVTAMTMLIVMSGVGLIAIVPYMIHMVRYTGGLYLTVEESHLTVRQRYELGRDIFRGNTYKYVGFMLSFLPWLLAIFAVAGYAGYDYLLSGAVSAKMLLIIPCAALFQFYVMPYMAIASMKRFDVLRGK